MSKKYSNDYQLIPSMIGGLTLLFVTIYLVVEVISLYHYHRFAVNKYTCFGSVALWFLILFSTKPNIPDLDDNGRNYMDV